MTIQTESVIGVLPRLRRLAANEPDGVLIAIDEIQRRLEAITQIEQLRDEARAEVFRLDEEQNDPGTDWDTDDLAAFHQEIGSLSALGVVLGLLTNA